MEIINCPKCGKRVYSEMIPETYVTREMAMDAGDLDLVGCLYQDSYCLIEEHECIEKNDKG